MKTFESESRKQTIDIAKDFARSLCPGDVVAMYGDLGAGKTQFVKGVAEAFGADPDWVASPTFTIVNQYDGQLTIYHFDAYRLENVSPDDCDWLDDYFFGEGICLVEWAGNIEGVLPRGYKKITIEKDSSRGDDFRRIVIE